MSKWERLNKEMSTALESMTQSDWILWDRNRESQKAMQRKTLLLKAKIQEEKIACASKKLAGQVILDSLISVEANYIVFSGANLESYLPADLLQAGNSQYAMAA